MAPGCRRVNQLPEDLKELAIRNGLDVRHASFHSDLDKLVRNLKARLGKADANRAEVGRRRRGDAAHKFAQWEEPRRTQSEQQPQQPIKPWLLPAIGAIAASLAVVSNEPIGPTKFVAFIVNALYGGTAGMLVPRFGILKAIAIPIIPGGVLAFVLLAVIGLVQKSHGIDAHQLQLHASFAGGIMFAWLAFWLHSKWVS
jgi:hypothetical protein